MKRVSTNILRGAVLGLGASVLALCIFALPAGIRSELNGDFDYGLIFVGMYIAALPFFYALHQTLKLLAHIDKNKAFSESSVEALRKVKYCALIISGLYTAGLPFIFHLANKDDAPGVFAIALLIVGTSFVIATSAGVLQQLIKNAVDIKTENDLTV